MMIYKLIVLAVLLKITVVVSKSQTTDTSFCNLPVNPYHSPYEFKPKKLIIPAVVITYGALSHTLPALKQVNYNIRSLVLRQDFRYTSIEDYVQYLPQVAALGLNVVGVKSRDTFKDMIFISLIQSGVNLALTRSIKSLSRVERPNETNYHSFPSGHTATAFMGAEFMYQQYKETSVWYGVGGYTVAGFVGTMRIVNNHHWFGDVVAGAGIGILSSKIAFWTYPTIKRWFTPKNKTQSQSKSQIQMIALPYFNSEGGGMSFAMRF